MCIISNGDGTEWSLIRSVIIRVIPKFITSMVTNCPRKKFCNLAENFFVPTSHKLSRVASAKVPQRFKEQKDYCLILNVKR